MNKGAPPPLWAPSAPCYELRRTVLLFMLFTLKFYLGQMLLATRRLLAEAGQPFASEILMSWPNLTIAIKM